MSANSTAAPMRMARSGQAVASDASDDDRDRVGGDHADRRAQPGAEQAVLGRERDRGEHRLVAELGQHEQRRPR